MLFNSNNYDLFGIKTCFHTNHIVLLS